MHVHISDIGIVAVLCVGGVGFVVTFELCDGGGMAIKFLLHVFE
jgi:hypothetical protein